MSFSAKSTPASNRLIVVSNRLPITISKAANGEFSFRMSSGGLVSALAGCKKSMDFTWIGWPGFALTGQDRALVVSHLRNEYACEAVHFSDEVADKHYNGFSNSVLWPLFHYHAHEVHFNKDIWSAYQEVNWLFAHAIYSQLKDGDTVWVHDYHLMLLPAMLRKLIQDDTKSCLIQNIKIGFFLHIPFPSFEVFRALPVAKEILTGVLASDLIGFHIQDYADHFLSSCSRILKISTLPTGVEVDGRYASVGAFPIGIEPESFITNLEKTSVQERISALGRRFEEVSVIVGVDRLDYIKGIPQKLQALELFFFQHPEMVGRVVLCQLAVPSREDVEEYKNLRSTVNELVGRINGCFGTADYTPIHFMYKSLPFDELCALYAASDICFVSSCRDGMNLVSYEYIACQQERFGTMVLSEFAGAAQSLRGSILVNPWDIQDMADAIYQAATMDVAEKKERHVRNFEYVKTYTAAYWGTSFVNALTDVSPSSAVDRSPKEVITMIDTLFADKERCHYTAGLPSPDSDSDIGL